MRALVLFAAASSILLGGCMHVFVDCIHGSGKMTTEQRNIAPFTGVVLKGSADVTITQGQVQEVTVEAEDNIVPLIRTAVEDGNIVIDARKCVQTDKPIEVHIVMPELRECSISGSGSITSRNEFRCRTLDVAVSGSGDIRLAASADDVHAAIAGSGDIALRGGAHALDTRISGSGDIDAGGMAVHLADVKISGSGDCTLNVAERLSAQISGSGDVFYSGPVTDVSSHVTGSGSVTRR